MEHSINKRGRNGFTEDPFHWRDHTFNWPPWSVIGGGSRMNVAWPTNPHQSISKTEPIIQWVPSGGRTLIEKNKPENSPSLFFQHSCGYCDIKKTFIGIYTLPKTPQYLTIICSESIVPNPPIPVIHRFWENAFISSKKDRLNEDELKPRNRSDVPRTHL